MRGDEALHIRAAAPEDQVAAKFALERLRVHVLCGDLDGVEHLHARVDQIGDQRRDRAAAVQANGRMGALPLHKAIQRRMVGLDHLPVHFRGDLRRDLRSQVIAAEPGQIQPRANAGEYLVQHLEVALGEIFRPAVDQFRLRGQEIVEVLKAKLLLSGLEHRAANVQKRGLVALLVQLPGLLFQKVQFLVADGGLTILALRSSISPRR